MIINDPQSGSHFVDAVSSKPKYETLSPNISNINNQALPSYLCFNEDGSRCAIAEHGTVAFFILGAVMNRWTQIRCAIIKSPITG